MGVTETVLHNPILGGVSVLFLGLIVGSFLNVVIYRLPEMMFAQWHRQTHPDEKTDAEPFNLFWPRSRCPHCRQLIAAWCNIPVISYLFLKGKCQKCQARIAWRYPVVELISGIGCLLIFGFFGPSWQAGAAILLFWALLVLTLIDMDHQLLPDQITLPLLWLGLISNSYSLFTTLDNALWGAIAGYLSLWSIYWIFKLITGKEGMGYGDFKLLAALGAWLGWQNLPMIIVLSSFVGACVGLALIIFRQHNRGTPIPFGPYLACAGLMTFFYGADIQAWYLHWSGL